MKILDKIILISILIINFKTTVSQNFIGNILGNEYYKSEAFSVSKLDDNNIFITGTFRNSYDEPDNVFILKTDINGILYFFYGYGKHLHDRALKAIVLKNEKLLITGESWAGFNSPGGRENVFFLKTNLNGFPETEKSYYNYHHDTGFSLLELSDGNILISGYTKSFADKKGDIYLLKTTAEGQKIWEKSFNESGNDFGFDIIENKDKTITILATNGGFQNNMEDAWQTHDADILLIKTDQNGNEILRKKIGTDKHDLGRKIINNPEGGYFIVGSSQSYGNGSFDVVLYKIDENFNLLSYKTFGNTHFDYGNSVCLSHDKKFLFIAAQTYLPDKETDMYVIKTDLNGDTVWTKTIGGNKCENANDIASLNDGSCFVAGSTESYVDKNISNIFIVKINSEGEIINQNLPQYLIKFYPNPVSETANVEIMSNTEITDVYLEIFDLNGKSLRNYKFNTTSFSFSVTNYRTTTYIYKIRINGYESYSGKFIVY